MEPVKEKDVKAFLDRLEEFTDKHSRCGQKPLAENIIKRVAMKCLPQTIIIHIAIAPDDAKTLRQVRRLVVNQMHNVQIGMVDGDASQPLYNMQDEKKPEDHKEEEEQGKGSSGRMAYS